MTVKIQIGTGKWAEETGLEKHNNFVSGMKDDVYVNIEDLGFHTNGIFIGALRKMGQENQSRDDLRSKRITGARFTKRL